MVIQRWQSVFLLLAAIFMALFTFTSFASVTGADAAAVDISPKDFPVYLVLNLLTTTLLLISIFLYRNLKLQKKVTKLSILLLFGSAVTGAVLMYGPNAPEGDVAPVVAGGVLLLVGAIVFAILALRGIKKDQNTLASYDRLR